MTVTPSVIWVMAPRVCESRWTRVGYSGMILAGSDIYSTLQVTSAQAAINWAME
jgi:hypothetical protein